jgi:primosomal protein N''
MFNVDKQVNQLEQQLGDQEDMNRRLVKDCQDYKRKLDKVVKERQEAFDSLESYQVIFEKCESSMLKMQ